MKSDVIAVIGFVVILMAICIIWNRCMIKQYNKYKSMKNIKIKYKLDNIERLELAGIESDGNNDYEFAKAVKKINVPDGIRVKIYE